MLSAEAVRNAATGSSVPADFQIVGRETPVDARNGFITQMADMMTRETDRLFGSDLRLSPAMEQRHVVWHTDSAGMDWQLWCSGTKLQVQGTVRESWLLQRLLVQVAPFSSFLTQQCDQLVREGLVGLGTYTVSHHAATMSSWVAITVTGTTEHDACTLYDRVRGYFLDVSVVDGPALVARPSIVEW